MTQNSFRQATWVRFVLLAMVLGVSACGGCDDDPASQAPTPEACKPPDVDPTGRVRFDEAVRFLYDGVCPRQTGVQKERLDALRVSVVRGRVLDADRKPLPGTRVFAPDHLELGESRTAADGSFDFVANGGEKVILRFALDGRMEAQRGIVLDRNRFFVLDDVVLLTESAKATAVQLDGSAQWQLASGETSAQDDAAPRTAHVLFPPGVKATATAADGAKTKLPSGTFRVTEFTRGASGFDAMPGVLPASSAYTYASNFGFDEAKNGVSFDVPVVGYVDNFLHMKTGTLVPAGTFAPASDAWGAEESGRVVAIVAGPNGAPALDANGDGAADSDAELSALRVLPGELDALKPVAALGKSFLRVPLRHFSPWDLNWAFAPPVDATSSPSPNDKNAPTVSCVQNGGSWFACESQLLSEAIPISGTEFSLHYTSERVPGHTDASTVDIAVTGATVPASAKRAEVEISVLGARTIQTYNVLSPNLVHTFTWDGRDGYGRVWPGETFAQVRVGLVYDGVYKDTPGFAAWPGASTSDAPVTGDKTRRELTLWRTYQARVGSWRQAGLGFGGWSISAHHSYDADAPELYYGDGRRRSSDTIGAVLDRVAEREDFQFARGVAVAADGTVYVSDTDNYRVRQISPTGVITTFAGTGKLAYSGDEGPALAADIGRPTGLAVRADGAVCFAASQSLGDVSSYLVRCVTRDGIIHTVLGGGTKRPDAAGIPARESGERLDRLAFAPDGSLFVAAGDFTLLRLDPNGTVHLAMGDGSDTGENVPASRAKLVQLRDVAFDRQGALYLAEAARVRRVDPSGLVTTVVGNGDLSGTTGHLGDGDALSARLAPACLALDAEGTLYVGDRVDGRVRRVSRGAITTFAGGGKVEPTSLQIPARTARTLPPSAVAVGPNAGLYSVNLNTLFRMRRSVMPNVSLGEQAITENDGSTIYVFDARGRHLRTLDALTGATRLSFFYDPNGRLARIEDPHGNVTQINRDAGGSVSIVAPFGQVTRLELGADGYLARMIGPLQRTESFSYAPGGLLAQRVDAGGGTHAMQYDPLGRLVRDENAEKASWTLARISTSPQQTRVTTGLGRTSVYEQTSLPDQDELRSVVHADGTRTAWTNGKDGSTHLISPDGTKTDTARGADPRFGMQAPYVSQSLITLPSGLSSNVDATQARRLAPDGALVGLDRTRTTADGTSRSSYDVPSRTWTFTSAAGRSSKATLDAGGRLTRVEMPGVLPLDIGYEARGRVAQLTRGDRFTRFGYEASSGAVRSIDDALGPELTLEHDEALRITAIVRADGARTTLGYDPLDALLTLAPPGRPAHAMTYGKDTLEASYKAPGASVVTRGYDADRAFGSVTHEDGAQTAIDRDAFGRAKTFRYKGGAVAITYDPVTAKAIDYAGPGAQTFHTDFDGSLPKTVTVGGATTGTVTWTHDRLFRRKTEQIGTSAPLSFGYDADGLLLTAGPVNVTREPETGRVSSWTVGGVSVAVTYTPHGEIKTYLATSPLGSVLDIANTAIDQRGRLRESKVNGVTWSYDYNAVNRLATVKKNGAVDASYTFDANGNRTDQGAQSNDQDQVSVMGGASFTYTARGERESKSAGGNVTTYAYDGRGQLVSVDNATPGVKIEYEIDAFNRRSARKKNGVVTHRLLYRSSLQPAAEVDVAGNVLSQFVYGRRANVPDVMIRGAVTYALITDLRGSVRVVVNVATGAVAQALEYDAFGRVLSDSNPGFQPFGFAGGIHDPDTLLTRFGARDYDPATGRWTSKDESRFEGGLNFYQYAYGDPVNWVDRTGYGPELALPALFGAELIAEGVFGTALFAGTVGHLFFAPPMTDTPGDVDDFFAVERNLELGGSLVALPSLADNVSSCPFDLEEEHTKNANPANKPKHQKGQARKKRDRGGEKADEDTRSPPRRRLKGHKGPWPP